MKVCILGVGRSGTTALYSLLQEILIDQLGRNVDFVYEPFLWDKDVFNKKYIDALRHFKNMDSISIEGMYYHQKLPLFIKNPSKFKKNKFLNHILKEKSKNTLIKFIRANGRFLLLDKICPQYKFIYVIRNPIDVVNSVIIRFSFYGAEFHKNDWHRFVQEVNNNFGNSIEETKIPLQIEREALYWYYMNKFAAVSFTKSSNKPLIICLEDYIARREFWVDRICDFLNLEKKDVYYNHSRQIGGTRTNRNNLNKNEFALLSGYLDKYQEILKTLGIEYAYDPERILAKYASLPRYSPRKDIIIGKTPNSMNTYLLKLEGELAKRINEIDYLAKCKSRLEETITKKEEEINQLRKELKEI